MASTTDVPDHARVVVVGAGLAGLTAARHSAALRPLVLERNPWIGGRTHSQPVGDGQWVDFGALWLPEPTAELARELGVEVHDERLPPPALAIKGRRVIERNPLRWFMKLPFSMRARYDFAKMGVRLLLALRGLEKGKGEDLTRMSLAEWLGSVHPDLQQLVSMWSTMAGARSPTEISARSGLEVVNAAVGRMTYQGAAYHVAVGGMGRLAQVLAEGLGDRVVKEATVTRVWQDASAAYVAYARDGVEHRIECEQCVIATPVPDILAVCEGLPTDKRAAFEAMTSTAAIGLGVVVEGASEAPWNRMYWLRTDGRDTITNVMNPAYFSKIKRAPSDLSALSILISGDRADAVADLTDDEIATRVLRELERIFPEARGHAHALQLVRHPVAQMRPPLDDDDIELRAASVGRIHFCGTDIVGVGTTYTAIETGLNAARRVAAFAGGPAAQPAA